MTTKAHAKLHGASMISDQAWLEIGSALGVTSRELQITQAIFDNLHKEAIAERLGISAHTIHTHLNRLFKKLNVTTRTELVLRVMEQLIALTLSETGLLPPICPRHHSGNCRRHTQSVPKARNPKQPGAISFRV